MKWLLSRNIILLIITAAVLIFAIRFFETVFHTGRLSTKIYVTIIGIIFLAVGAFAAAQLIRRKTITEQDRVDRSIRDHLNIIEALEARDTHRAEDLVRTHALGLADHVSRYADYLD